MAWFIWFVNNLPEFCGTGKWTICFLFSTIKIIKIFHEQKKRPFNIWLKIEFSIILYWMTIDDLFNCVWVRNSSNLPFFTRTILIPIRFVKRTRKREEKKKMRQKTLLDSKVEKRVNSFELIKSSCEETIFRRFYSHLFWMMKTAQGITKF